MKKGRKYRNIATDKVWVCLRVYRGQAMGIPETQIGHDGFAFFMFDPEFEERTNDWNSPTE